MEARFDHEKLDVYRLLLELISWISELIEEMKKDARGQTQEVRDHLRRAGLSALFNTAEGNGKRRRRIRAKFFDDARGSAAECAACLDAPVAIGSCSGDRVEKGKTMPVRIVSLLTKLVERFDVEGETDGKATAQTDQEGRGDGLAS